jgi:hypothetical protein
VKICQIAKAKETEAKIDVELKDLQATLSNIQDARPFEDLTVRHTPFPHWRNRTYTYRANAVRRSWPGTPTYRRDDRDHGEEGQVDRTRIQGEVRRPVAHVIGGPLVVAFGIELENETSSMRVGVLLLTKILCGDSGSVFIQAPSGRQPRLSSIVSAKNFAAQGQVESTTRFNEYHIHISLSQKLYSVRIPSTHSPTTQHAPTG